MISNIDYYYKNGYIKKSQEKKYLLQKLYRIKYLMLIKENLLSESKNSNWKRGLLERWMNGIIEKEIEKISRHIEKQSAKKISKQAADLLIQSLTHIKSTL